MNLTNEPWIPVRRADGSPDKIAPYQITDHIGTDKSPIIAVASPRPDFDGALVQFLIGLLQTTCTPETDADWWDWREQPPTSEELSLRFEPVSLAFQLKGAQPFMQEKLIGSSQAKWHPFSYLLIGAATDSTLKNNTDHFQKRVPENSVIAFSVLLRRYTPFKLSRRGAVAEVMENSLAFEVVVLLQL